MNTYRNCHKPSQKKASDNLFVIAVGDASGRDRFSSQKEYNMFIWSFLSPPAISKPTPIIQAERYETVRKALEPLRVDNDPDLKSVHCTSSFHVDQLEDGTLIKTVSKTELKVYNGNVDVKVGYVSDNFDCDD